MQAIKKLAGQTAIYGLSSILGRFLNYLLTPLYTYQFVAKEYGVVTEMYAYVAFLVVLLTFGMETTYFRYASGNQPKERVFNSVLFPVIVVGIIFMTLGVIFSGSLAELIEYPNHPEYVVWFSIIVAFDAICSIPLAKLRHENRAKRFAAINISSILVNISLNLFVIAYLKVEYDQGNTGWVIENLYNPAIGVGYIFIINLISTLFKTLLLSPIILSFRFSIDKELFGKMLRYTAPLLIVGLAGIANENIDRILLKYLLIDTLGHDVTMAQIGIYGACYKVSILITLFIQAYRYAAEPFFFNQSDAVNAKETYAQLMKYFVIVCLLIFLVLMLNINLVMGFVGEEYRVGVQIVPILLMANVFLGIYYNLSIWYKLVDKTSYGAYIALMGAFITIVLNFLLIPKLGYVGSAWTTLVCYGSMVIASYFLGQRFYPVHYPMGRLFGYFAITLGLYALSLGMSWENFVIKTIVNNGLILAMAVFIFILERPKKIII